MSFAPETYPTGGPPHTAHIGDFDGDGDVDVVTGNNDRVDGISVLMNNGNGTFAAHVGYTTRANPVSVVPADLDGDGDLGFAAVDGSGASSKSLVEILLNDGRGIFVYGESYRLDGGHFSITAGDLNGDGRPDLITSKLASNAVTPLMNKGDATFEVRDDLIVGSAPISTITADFDGDGDVDLASAIASSQVGVLFNRGDGSYETVVRYPLGG